MQHARNTSRTPATAPPVRPRRAFRPSTLDSRPSTNPGFTLAEMLVATALVMLIMLLFAEVFQAAVGTLTEQRGLSNNDAKARTVVTTLRSDLQSATNRQPISGDVKGIVAFGPNDIVDSRQQGFFYFAENDPLNDADDRLHLTVFTDETSRAPAQEDAVRIPFFGRAQPIGRPDGSGVNANDRNQPDVDDGEFGNSAAVSRAAEVTYFLRNGNLYRRYLLLREPLSNASPPFGPQPEIGSGADEGELLVPLSYNLNADVAGPTPGGQDFWHDFDFSATFRNGGLRFNGVVSLDNSVGLSNEPIALPGNRFGFHPNFPLPREYLNRNDAIGVTWIGGFTHEETSHPGFGWPGFNTNIITRNDLVFSSAGVVTEPSGPTVLSGSRVGEDILLTGVEAFDVEVWDPLYIEGDADGSGDWDAFHPLDDYNGDGLRQTGGAFVDLGHGLRPVTSWFHHLRNANRAFGGRTYAPGGFSLGGDGQPGDAGVDDDGDGNTDSIAGNPDVKEIGWPGTDDVINRTFDTWHPQMLDLPPGQSPGSAPFRPLRVATPDVIAWNALQGYGIGQVYFPDLLGPDRSPGRQFVNDDGVNSITDFDGSGNPDLDEIGWPGSDDNTSPSFAYRVISGGTSGAREPTWPRRPGAIVQDGGVTWQSFDNRVGLEQIRITIRFRDPGSGQKRQVTLIHSFVE